MKISIKHIIYLWSFLLVGIGVLLYGAYSKLNPQSLLKLLNQQIEKNYPGSVVNIGHVNYKFALDFNLELQNLKLTRGQDQIADAGLVEIKIPWWLLVFNKGSVLVTLNNLNLYVSKTLPAEITQKKNINSSSISFNLPSYLSEASYSFRVQEVAIKELGGDRNFFTLSKFLIRDFQNGKNSAFEINVPITITASGKKYSSELWLFGDVTPEIGEWILNYRGEFKTRDSSESFHFDDLIIDGKAKLNTSNFDISSQLNILVDKKEVGQGSLVSHLEKMELKMKFTQMPVEYLLLAGNPIKNPFWEKMEGRGAGEINLTHQADKENYFSLNGKVNFPGEFKFSGNLSLPGKWLLKFENSNWETSFISNAGEVNFFKRSAIDFTTGQINQFSQEIGLNGINLQEASLPIESIANYLSNNQMIFHSTYLILKKCQYGNSIIDGSFLFGKNPDHKFYQADLATESGKMSLKYSSNEILNKMEMSFNSFPWYDFQFLNPFFVMQDGILTGNLQGEWKESFSTGTWITKLNILNSKNLNGEFAELLSYINQNIEIMNQPQNVINFEGSFNKEVLRLKYILGDKSPTAVGGVLSLNPKIKSSLVLSYPKNRNIKPSRKEIINFSWPGSSNE